jgi:hypothetical protein
MSRRSFVVALTLVLLLFGGGALVLFLVVGYEPAVYSKAVPPTPEVRARRSHEFLTEFFHLYHEATAADQNWAVQFTDEEINGYLDEGFIQQGLAQRILPDGISRPHVVFDKDEIHLAFRYGAGAWNTVISIDLKVWLAKAEPNAVALELEGLRAGALPISGHWLLEAFSKVGRDNGSSVDVSWYRHDSHPVALVRFQSDQPHPTLLLQAVGLQPGLLIIRGASPDAAPVRTLLRLPAAALKPAAN